MKTKKKIGIIGFGNMGQAIAKRLKDSYEIHVFDKDKNKTKDSSGVIVNQEIEDLLTITEIIILAVKPQDFRALLDSIKGFIQNKLVISIAAGISTSFIERHLEATPRIVRVMPNIPVKIGEGISCLCKGSIAKDGDIKSAEEIFKHLGITLLLDEKKMDAATAISGSGPGYLCDFIENNGMDMEKAEEFKIKLGNAAKSLGFNNAEATTLAKATTSGTLKMLKAGNIAPAQLKKQVTSKGGTTEAGLKAWHKKDGTLKDAVEAALKRAKELSK